jgi:hypothetical protein
MGQAVDSYSQAEAENYIKDSTSAWAESIATNDASVVTRILADDCVWGVGRQGAGQVSCGDSSTTGSRRLRFKSLGLRQRAFLWRHGDCPRSRDVDAKGREFRPLRLDRYLGSTRRDMAGRCGDRRARARSDQGLAVMQTCRFLRLSAILAALRPHNSHCRSRRTADCGAWRD